MMKFDSFILSIIPHRTIFTKLLIALIASIFLIYSMGVFIYNWGITTIQNEITNRYEAQLDYYLNTFSKDIDQIRALQSRYLLGREISWMFNTFKNMNNYNRGYYALRIQDNMISLKDSSIYLENVIVYMPTIGKKIQAVGGYENLGPDELAAQEDLIVHKDSILSTDGTNLYLNLSYPTNAILIKKPPFYTIQAFFSLEALERSLEQFNLYYDAGSILFKDNYPSIVAAKGEKHIAEKVIEQINKHNEKKQNAKENSGAFSANIDNELYLITYAKSNNLGYTLANYTPESEIFQQVNTNQYIIWILTIIAAVILAYLIFFVYHTIQSPMGKLIEAFKRVDGGDRNFIITYKQQDEFRYLYTRFNDMLANINDLIKNSYEQKLMLKNAELNQLQSQINPHFIYNSYFLLHRMVKSDDKENAVYFSKLMGTYFQFITKSMGSSVTLCKEIEHARIYTEIQGMRFANKIDIMFEELPSEYNKLFVPRLIVQPILENAFEYAFSDMLSCGKLYITFEHKDSFLVIKVDDNGEGLTDETLDMLNVRLDSGDFSSGESIGLLNIHRRLQAAFPGRGKMEISRSELGGMQVKLHIPLESDGKQNNVQNNDC